MSRAVVSIKLAQDFGQVRLAVSLSPNLAGPTYSTPYATTNKMVKITMDGLQADTQYYYGVVIEGVLQQEGRGKFRTFPASAASFTCAFGSCAPTGNNNTVFDDIRNLDPLFFIHMGDLHYQNITANNVTLFREAYDLVFAASRQAQLYANVPTMYVWDDHDFTNNDGDGTSASKPAAQMAYKERVPHYPLNATDGGIGQSWVVGRVRFIMPDLMSYKTPMETADTLAKTQFGENQLQWFFNELLKPEPLKIFVNTKPWIGPAETISDKWFGFTRERERIANFIRDNNLQYRVAIISGDMHGLAIDNGTNSDYATGGGGAIPVFQAAPLGSSGSVKGGPWSAGSFTNGGSGNQYGVMTITDDGTASDIVMTWQGKRGAETLVTYTLNVPSAAYVRAPDTTPPIVTATPAGGTFSNVRTVTLAADELADLYYTLDGSTPTTASTLYTDFLTLDATTTLKFFGVDASGNSSPVQTETYTLTSSTVGLPTGGQLVHIDAAQSPKTYLTDGRIQTIEDLSGYNHHAVQSSVSPMPDTTTFSHTVLDFNPSFTGSTGGEWLLIDSLSGDLGGEFTLLVTLALDNTTASQRPISMIDNTNTVIRALEIRGTTNTLRLAGDTGAPELGLSQHTPGVMGVFTVTSGANSKLYLNGAEVDRALVGNITSLANIDNIRLGKNAADAPVENFDGKMGDFALYNRVLSYEELKQAHTTLLGKWNLLATTAPVVTVSPSPSSFTDAVDVTLSSDTLADIHFTIDGSTPTAASPLYTDPFTLTATTAVKYFAISATGGSSAVQTATFTTTAAADIPASGLVAHYSMTHSTVTLDTDGRILSVSDLSTNGLTAARVATSPFPDSTTYVHPVMDFQGAPSTSTISEWLNVSGFGNKLTNSFTVFVTAVLDDTTDSQNLVTFHDAANVAVRSVSVRGADSHFELFGDSTPPSFPLTGNYAGGLATFTTRTTASSAQVYLNGTQMATQTVTTPAALAAVNNVRIGKNASVESVANFDGKIGELLIYNRALTTAELTQVHNYLSAKWHP